MSPGQEVAVRVGLMKYRLPWVGSYGEVVEGRPLLHIDSVGLMALAVRGGRADEHFTLGAGTSVVIAGQP